MWEISKCFKKKKKKEQCGLEQYKNLPEDEKQNLLSIEKNVIKWETKILKM